MRVVEGTLGLAAGAAVFFAVANAFIAFGRNGMLEFAVSATLAVVVTALMVKRARRPRSARPGGPVAFAVLVTAGVAVSVNQFQLARWPEGCRDVLRILVSPTASPSCAPPDLTDVPLPWLGPLLGFAVGLAALTWWLRRRAGTGLPS